MLNSTVVGSLPGAVFCPQAGDRHCRDQKISQMLPREECQELHFVHKLVIVTAGARKLAGH